MNIRSWILLVAAIALAFGISASSRDDGNAGASSDETGSFQSTNNPPLELASPRGNAPERSPLQAGQNPGQAALAQSPDSVVLSGVLIGIEQLDLHLVFLGVNGDEYAVDVQADGSWRTTLPTGTWSVRAMSKACSHIDLMVAPNQVAAQETVEVSLRLLPGQVVSGEAVDCLGAPIPGVRLRSSSDPCTVEATPSGSFSLPVGMDEGPTNIRVDQGSLPPGISLPWWQEAQDQGGVAVGEPAFLAGTPARVELQLLRDVQGMAIRDTGQPMTNATLSIRGRFGWDPATQNVTGPIFGVRTDAGGNFEIKNLPSGQFEAWPIYVPESAIRPNPVAFQVNCGDDYIAPLKFDGGLGASTLLGTVVNSNGIPMPGIGFGIWEVSGSFDSAIKENFPIKATFTSDANGLISVQWLPESEYYLVRNKPQVPNRSLIYLDQVEFKNVRTHNTDSTPFTWVVDGFDPGSLRVTIEQATPPAKVNVLVTTTSGSTHSFVQKVISGMAYFDEIPPGIAEVSLEARGKGEPALKTPSHSTKIASGSLSEVILK